MINFYEQKEMKKYLPDFKDEQVQFTGIKLRTRNLFAGSSGSGKTNCLMNYIHETSKPKKGTFKHVYMMFKTSEPLYDCLIDKLKDKITVFKDLKNVPDCNTFPDSPEDCEMLFIWDDVVNETSIASLKKIKDYFIFGRKKNFTQVFLTQSYFQTNKMVRDQMDNIILLSIKSQQDLNRIIKEYEIPKITKEQVNNMFDYCTEKQFNFMKIATGKCPIDKKFSLNWINYLNPNDFQSNDTLRIKDKRRKKKRGGDLLEIENKEESDNDSNSESDSEEDDKYKRNEIKTLSEEANDKLKQRRHELNLLKAILNKNKKEN
jgi:hypothetical protein